jgi:16S rRNA (guanine527-N7)-methyltransferase
VSDRDIAQFCTRHDLPWDERRAERLASYRELLLRFNESMNLIGPLDAEAIDRELLIDSLAAGVARAPRGPILDVGTGAGLPGIPLAIVFEDVALTLVEPRRKRSTFLRIATNRLGLSDVTLERARIEDLTETSRFDTVISKAFQDPREWLETARPWVRPGGAVICMARPDLGEELGARAEALGMSLVGEARHRVEREVGERAVFAFSG